MFRPCIDLHQGKVKQIVGGSLTDDSADLKTNFVSDRSAAYYAELYRRDGLRGGHVIMLGGGNEEQARAALAAFPGGLQIGGGLTIDNAPGWLEAGASQVIITSWVFREGAIDWDRLAALKKSLGKGRLVLDLSCRKRQEQFLVVTDRWQKFTSFAINGDNLSKLAEYCSEFLVHAVEVEGKCGGVDLELVTTLGELSPLPATYAGGASSLADLEKVTAAGKDRVDLTIGSALDIFGGSGVKYQDVVQYNQRRAAGVQSI